MNTGGRLKAAPFTVVLLLPVDFSDEREGARAYAADPEQSFRAEGREYLPGKQSKSCFWTEWQQEEESYGTEHTKAVGMG